MKREDIEAALTGIISRAAAWAEQPTPLLGATAILFAVKAAALLAAVVADQERRLRVLEPCPERRIAALPPSDPHRWIEDGPEVYTCQFCGVKR